MKSNAVFSAVAIVMALAAPAAMAREGHAHGGPGMMHGPGMLFGRLDTDQDGKLSREEMETRMQERIKAADTDSDGFLSREEMLVIANTRAEAMVDSMLERMDADEDGKLSEAELTARPKRQNMFERLDADGDGAISLEEFREAREQMRGMRRHHRWMGDDHGN